MKHNFDFSNRIDRYGYSEQFFLRGVILQFARMGKGRRIWRRDKKHKNTYVALSLASYYLSMAWHMFTYSIMDGMRVIDTALTLKSFVYLLLENKEKEHPLWNTIVRIKTFCYHILERKKQKRQIGTNRRQIFPFYGLILYIINRDLRVYIYIIYADGPTSSRIHEYLLFCHIYSQKFICKLSAYFSFPK